ncbi:MAG: DUF5688 family protein [Lachnospiraceae bacterium]|nr:DUF5688 family protein [Lachnospiraceae bacterium]MDD3615987.1 DUF5688 family protein [Lachnospiraceae bacterium]
MKYEEFTRYLLESIKERMGEEVKIERHKITKNNGIILDAFTIRGVEDNLSPTFYLEQFYQEYEEGYSIAWMEERVLSVWKEGKATRKVSVEYFKDFNQIRNRVVYRLVNCRKNEALLKEIPYIPVLDLAMVFYYQLPEHILEHATVLIRKQDLKRWNVDFDAVKAAAMENTPKLLPSQFLSIGDMMESIFCETTDEDPLEKNIREIIEEERQEQTRVPMYVLTNTNKYYGAACALYPGVLEKISQRLHANLFVLPSSIHEVILIPNSGDYSKEELEEMVTDINETQLEPEEFLSNQVYRYEMGSNQIKF